MQMCKLLLQKLAFLCTFLAFLCIFNINGGDFGPIFTLFYNQTKKKLKKHKKRRPICPIRK